MVSIGTWMVVVGTWMVCLGTWMVFFATYMVSDWRRLLRSSWGKIFEHCAPDPGYIPVPWVSLRALGPRDLGPNPKFS